MPAFSGMWQAIVRGCRLHPGGYQVDVDGRRGFAPGICALLLGLIPVGRSMSRARAKSARLFRRGPLPSSRNFFRLQNRSVWHRVRRRWLAVSSHIRPNATSYRAAMERSVRLFFVRRTTTSTRTSSPRDALQHSRRPSGAVYGPPLPPARTNWQMGVGLLRQWRMQLKEYSGLPKDSCGLHIIISHL